MSPVLDTATIPEGCPFFQACTCQRSRLGNRVCDAECNNPDCNFDSGDCCSETNPSPYSEGNNPLVCFDPRFSEAHNTFRVDYNKPQCRTPIRNQGSCGSCWAFAGATTAQYMACHLGDPAPVAFSPMHADSCVAPNIGEWAGRCNGGSPYWVLDNWSSGGMRTAECFPYAYSGDGRQHFSAIVADIYSCEQAYAAKTDECTASTDNAYKLKPGVPKQIVTLDVTPANKETILGKLRATGAMPIVFKTDPEAFISDPTQAYTGPRPDARFSGGHATTLIGYGEYVRRDAGGARTRSFWVMENSWGSIHDGGAFYWDADANLFDELGYLYVQTWADPPAPSAPAQLQDVVPAWGSAERRRQLLQEEAEGEAGGSEDVIASMHRVRRERRARAAQRAAARRLLQAGEPEGEGEGQEDGELFGLPEPQEMPAGAVRGEGVPLIAGGPEPMNCSSDAVQSAISDVVGQLEAQLNGGNLTVGSVGSGSLSLNVSKSKVCTEKVTASIERGFSLELVVVEEAVNGTVPNGTTVLDLAVTFEEPRPPPRGEAPADAGAVCSLAEDGVTPVCENATLAPRPAALQAQVVAELFIPLPEPPPPAARDDTLLIAACSAAGGAALLGCLALAWLRRRRRAPGLSPPASPGTLEEMMSSVASSRELEFAVHQKAKHNQVMPLDPSFEDQTPPDWLRGSWGGRSSGGDSFGVISPRT